MDYQALMYPSTGDSESEYLREGRETKGKGREEDGGEPNWGGTLLPLETDRVVQIKRLPVISEEYFDVRRRFAD